MNYIRWGRTACPDTEGTELLYSGRAAGAHYSHTGGGSNYLCLPDNPDTLQVVDGHQGSRSAIYGAEYQVDDSPAPLHNMHDHNVPCAVCYTAIRGDKIMIPAKIDCTGGWTKEYYGYLMSAHHGHHQRTTYECIDVNAESVPDSAANNDGILFYHTEIYCVGLDCPPYVEGNELPCVVCTK